MARKVNTPKLGYDPTAGTVTLKVGDYDYLLRENKRLTVALGNEMAMNKKLHSELRKARKPRSILAWFKERT